MILVDTSVWILHLREGNAHLKKILTQARVLTHPFIIGELSCGSMRNRRFILDLLEDLPKVNSAEHDEVIKLIETRRFYSKGIGWIDAHLLSSALISGVQLWTFDQRLRQLALQLKINYSPISE